MLGQTPRSQNNNYLFAGDIMDLSVYATAMSDEEMIAYTNINVSVPDGEGSSQENIFAATKSRYYRIPALMTLKDGGLMAAVDARFGSAGDSRIIWIQQLYSGRPDRLNGKMQQFRSILLIFLILRGQYPEIVHPLLIRLSCRRKTVQFI